MKKLTIAIAVSAVLLLSLFWTGSTQAQGSESGWSEIHRLSSDAGRASEAYMVTDQYGYVHAFWTETLFENGQSIIKYSRFDGTTWTKPNDIFVASQDVNNISPVVDKQGILHIAWSEGLFGRTYYSYAPVNTALSAQSWAKPIQVQISARPVFLRVDSKGVFHILYINPTDQTGVFYVRSEDKGLTWSEPVWLDPDIPAGQIPDSLNFQIDENDGLHAVWWYGSRQIGINPDWVRYTHSLDGGHTWSTPFTIDRLIEGSDSDYNLNAASPVMAVEGKTVHVMWAGGNQAYRNYRSSSDDGVTWTEPVRIFGDLQGQAFDSLTVDGAGRVHFFGQVRYPIGIYHAYWDHGQWSNPSMIYFIAGQDGDMGNRIHAHLLRAVVRVGNQLVLTFGDPPADEKRRLFVMYRTLDDIPAAGTIPTPEVKLIPTPSPIAAQTETSPTAMATAVLEINTSQGQPSESVPKPDLLIQLGLVPVLLILGGTFFYHWRNKHKL